MRKLIACLFGITTLAAHAANFEVTNNNDSGAGSLRQSLIEANASGAVPHIIIFTDEFLLNGSITLASALPTIAASDVRIRGVARNPTVNGNAQYPILRVGNNVSLEVEDMNFSYGLNAQGGCIALNSTNSTSSLYVSNVFFYNCKANDPTTAGGGAIAWKSAGSQTVVIEDSLFTDNSAISSNAANEQPRGGAIESYAATTIRNSRFEDNLVQSADIRGGFGGAVYIVSPASFSEITGNTFKNNSVDPTTNNLGWGGAVRVFLSTGAQLLVQKNFFASNVGRSGGAVYLDASGGAVNTGVTLNNNTFVDNTVQADGGAAYLANVHLTANHNTFFDNGANAGSDLFLQTVTVPRFVHNVLAPTQFEAACSLPGSSIVSGYLAGNLFNEDCGILSSTGGAISANLAVQEVDGNDSRGVVLFATGSAPIDGGTLSPSDCLPADAQGTMRPLDGDFDSIKICDVGALEHPDDTQFSDGFE